MLAVFISLIELSKIFKSKLLQQFYRITLRGEWFFSYSNNSNNTNCKNT